MVNTLFDSFHQWNTVTMLLNDLPGVECSLPGGAFYAFPNVSGTGMSGSEFCKKAMHEAGVAIVPGTAFGKTCNDYVLSLIHI